MRIAHRCLTVALLTIPAGGLALGSQAIPNWPAPAVWTPPRPTRGLTILGDISNPLPFIGVTPCRQYDSRNFTPLPDNTNRSVTLTGAPCGVPASAQAFSVNITVFSITGAGGNGVFKVGIANDPTTAWLNYPPTETQRGNAGVLPVNGSGQIVVEVAQGGGSVNFTVDINGYYALFSASSTFEWDTAGPVGIVGNSIASTGQSFGVIGQVNSPTDGSAGVSGTSLATTGAAYGVLGSTASISANAAGVRGVVAGEVPTSIPLPAGVLGESASYAGVVGSSRDFSGVIGAQFDSAGNLYTAGFVGTTPYGVQGIVQQAIHTDEAGVFGNDATGLAGGVGKPSAGVRGESKTNVGVLGQGQAEAISGELLSTSGAFVVSGALGTVQAGHNYGVYSTGDFGGTGAKYFVEPHPTDATRVIRYVALEGPEAGTYFRGRAKLSNGSAVIPVPESFRLVSDEEGLTVQITPIGEPVTIAVTEVGLNQIVVQASKDVEFFYTVNGVRQTFKDLEVISQSREYMPRSADARMPEGFSPEQKRRLIANGTYNPDGTVNMQTAERVGWTRVWKEWEERDKAAVAAARAKGVARSRPDARATPGDKN